MRMVRAELIEWAKQRIEKGFTVEQLRESLEKAGYPAADVDEIIRSVTEEQHPAPKPEPVEEAPKPKEEPEKKPSKQPKIPETKKMSRHKIVRQSLFDEEAEKKRRGDGRAKGRGASFFNNHEMGIATGLIFLAVIVLVGSIILNTMWKADSSTPSQEESVVLKLITEEITTQKTAGVNSSFKRLTLVQGDYVVADDLIPAAGGAVVFCAGEIYKPNGCDEEIWQIESPCPEEYTLTSGSNQAFFSSDTNQAGFHVTRAVSGELKISQVCGTYFIGFKTL